MNFRSLEKLNLKKKFLHEFHERDKKRFLLMKLVLRFVKICFRKYMVKLQILKYYLKIECEIVKENFLRSHSLALAFEGHRLGIGMPDMKTQGHAII